MADEILKLDANSRPVAGGVTDDANQDIVMLRVDPITGELLCQAAGVAGTLEDVLAAGNHSGPYDIIMDAGQKITTNTIAETTAAAGVTVDGVLLKDGLVGAAYGGTGVANNAANTITFTGNFSLGLTLSNNTSVTLPTTGTLATLAGSEALTNKTVNGLTITASTGTLTITNGKTFTTLKTMSFTAADDTGVYTLPTGTKTLLATDGAGTSLTGIPYTLTGTADQVVLSAGTGNITFSLPQSIATTSSPTFAGLTTDVVATSTSVGVVITASAASGVAAGSGAISMIADAVDKARWETFAYAAAPVFQANRANGTLASPTATAANDSMCVMQSRGYQTTASPGFTSTRIGYTHKAAEAFTNTAQGTYHIWTTTAIGTTTTSEKMRLSDVGLLTVPQISVTQTATTGYALTASRNLASGSTDASLVYFNNASSTDDQNTTWFDQNSNALTSLFRGLHTSCEVITQVIGSASNHYAFARVTNDQNYHVGYGIQPGGGCFIKLSQSITGTTLVFQVAHNDGGTQSIQINGAGSCILGNAAIATNATDGFLYVVGCAGTPTGAPTAATGRYPLVYDSSANKIWVYNGSWRGVAVT